MFGGHHLGATVGAPNGHGHQGVGLTNQFFDRFGESLVDVDLLNHEFEGGALNSRSARLVFLDDHVGNLTAAEFQG